MSDKKHIDRLFQEGLKNFEATPDTAVWETIETSLGAERKKRRVIPLWWKLAGVAAGLVLLFSIGTTLFNNDDGSTTESILVDTEKSVSDDNETTNSNKNELEDSSNTKTLNDIVDTETSTNNSEEDTASKDIMNVSKEASNDPSNIVATTTNSETKNKKLASSKKSNATNLQNTAYKTQKETVAYNKNKSLQNKTNSTNNNRNSQQNVIDKVVTNQLIKNSTETSNETLVNSDTNSSNKEETEETSVEDTLTDEVAKEDEKPSIEDAIAENETEDKDIIEEERLTRRWNVMPNVAPVYFNTLGKGSSIDSQFTNNDKSGTVNMSYGITASYAISERLSVRTGVNKVKVGYNTNDVLIYEGVEPIDPTDRPIKNIDFNENGQNISVISADGLQFAQVPNIFTNAIDASLDQRIGFIEVPLELAYKISDRKLGISVIGGVSALFLDENEVYSTLNGNSTLLGEANNINDTSFSANLGLGLDYKLSDKFNINLEPVFKYQMNTFENTSGDFKPFLIGVYTGFSFKF